MEAGVIPREFRDRKIVADPRIIKGISLIGQRLSTSVIDLDEITRAVNLSNSRFRHLFQQQIGLTPRRYHKLLRLQKAHDLLCTSFLSVKQVMVEVGWTDESHFCRDYKGIYGECPSRARFSAIRENEPQPRLA